MDRFKFRVWDIEDCSYICRNDFDSIWFDKDGELHIGMYSDFTQGIEDYTDNVIIEQCTGLKDKNGNLIYEGDIVKNSLLGQKYTVNWDCDSVQFEATAKVNGYETEFSEIYGLYVNSAKELEIVGNIHEQKDNK